jgi:hypothetical protein
MQPGPRGIEAARGRIAFDFTGDACEGYALSFRQVTVLESGEGEPRTSDMRSTTFEEGEGASFKFRSESLSGDVAAKIVDGDAERRDGALVVRLNRPKKGRLDFGETALFPTAHMKKLIVAAEAGETIVAVKVFDGSDDGRRVYDTLSVIGRRIEPGTSAALRGRAKKPGLDTLPRWPVTISYFTPGRASACRSTPSASSSHRTASAARPPRLRDFLAERRHEADRPVAGERLPALSGPGGRLRAGTVPDLTTAGGRAA